jgi:hypothetical protein
VNYSYINAYILYNKLLIITYLLRPRESSVFCGPETAVVSRGKAKGNNGGRVIYPELIPWGGGVSYTWGLIYGQHLVLVLNFIVPVNYVVNSLSQNMLMTSGKHIAK